jgi:hypothetical protein
VARTLAGTALVLALGLGAGTGTVAGAVPGELRPGRCGESQRDQPKRCVGPVVDESGGGGDTLTIVASVLVGLAVAGVAFVLLRRQLSRGTRA